MPIRHTIADPAATIPSRALGLGKERIVFSSDQGVPTPLTLCCDDASEVDEGVERQVERVEATEDAASALESLTVTALVTADGRSAVGSKPRRVDGTSGFENG